MNRAEFFNRGLGLCAVLLITVAVDDAATRRASAESLTYQTAAAKDNTLFEIGRTQQISKFYSNGRGNFFAAGRSKGQNQIQRGVIQFDLSAVPAGSSVTDVSLRLFVLDVPKSDRDTARDFWLAALGRDWGEADLLGTGIDIHDYQAGRGAPACNGDATWWHTGYDAAIHETMEFSPERSDFWGQEGAIGPALISRQQAVQRYGAAPIVAPGEQGFVTFQCTTEVLADVQGWVDEPSINFGWALLGEEWISGEEATSKRGFASREYDVVSSWQPMLTVTYAPIPEPSLWTMCLTGAVTFGGCAWRRRSRMRKEG